MKKLFFLWIALCVVSAAQAQTVVNTTVGNLSADLIAAAGGETNVGGITDLKINGTLGEQDFTYLRSAVGANLVKIDLSGITAIENQTLPRAAFSGSDYLALETVILPEKKDGVPVLTTIAAQAFQITSALRQVNIPDGVVSFATNVFYGSGIRNLILPNSVTTIGNNAFQDSSIESITLSENLTAIPNNAFFRARSLKSIHIPGSVQSIGNNAFNQAGELETVTFGDGITSIGGTDQASYIFASTKVKSIVLPNSVTSIGYGAFQNAAELEQITLSQNLETIGDFAFTGTKLTAVDLPAGLKSIGNGAFSDLSTLTEITLPTALETLSGNSTFAGTGISSLVIPANTQIVNGTLTGTFANAANLSSLTLNNNITKIGANTFQGTALSELIIPEGVTELQARSLYGINLINLELPNSLKTISGILLAPDQWGSFGTNNTLVSLKIGNGLETIAEAAFAGFTALKIFTITNPLPPILDPDTRKYVFYDIVKEGADACVLYVPAEGLVSTEEYDNYRTAPGWKDFMPNIQAIIIAQAQSITWGEDVVEGVISKTTTDDDFELTATATSGLEITYTITEGNGTVAELLSDGKTVTTKGAGTAKIKASQAGNDEWEAAEDVEITLTVTGGSGLWDVKNNASFALQGNPLQNEARFSFESAGSGASIVISDLSGKTVTVQTVASGSTEAVVNVSSLPKGVYVARYTDSNGKQGTVKLVK